MKLTSNDKNSLKKLKSIANSLSQDNDTQVGVLIKLETEETVAGANKLPYGIAIKKYRNIRPFKYRWIEHAERDVITRCAFNGQSTKGASLYMSWFPCNECAKMIINAGIEKLYCQPHTIEDISHEINEQYHFDIALEMLEEAGVIIVPWTEEDLQ